MKYIKKFENIDKPEVGDYIKIYIPVDIYTPSLKKYYYFWLCCMKL